MKTEDVVTETVTEAIRPSKARDERKRVPGNLEIALFDSELKYGGLDDKGQPYVRRRESVFDQPTSIGDKGPVRGQQCELPIRIGNSNLILPLGLSVITGPTAAGKSTFLRKLGEQVPTDRVLAVEPHDEAGDISDLPFFVTVDAAMMFLIARQRKAFEDGIPPVVSVLDSLRASVFETEGAAGEKGMVMRFFTTLTRISSTLARNGVSILATVNPLQSDAQTINAFVDRLKSSVPCVIELNSTTRSGNDVTFTGQVSVRPKRDPRPFSETWTTGAPVEQKKRDINFFDFPLPDDSIVDPLSARERNAFSSSTI